MPCILFLGKKAKKSESVEDKENDTTLLLLLRLFRVFWHLLTLAARILVTAFGCMVKRWIVYHCLWNGIHASSQAFCSLENRTGLWKMLLVTFAAYETRVTRFWRLILFSLNTCIDFSRNRKPMKNVLMLEIKENFFFFWQHCDFMAWGLWEIRKGKQEISLNNENVFY